MRSISILGCGWLGFPLGKHLAQAGYQVKGLTTKKDKLSKLTEAGIKAYQLSLEPELSNDPDDFFASDITIINLPPRNKDGVEGFHECQLKEIIRHLKSQQVIFISSTAVYPSHNSKVTEKDAQLENLTRGGISLLQMEKLFTENTSFQTTVIRFGGLYGPGRHPGRFLAGKKNLAGANNPVNMIHLNDCIGVIQTIIEQHIWGEVLNASSPSEESRKLFYEKAAMELDLEPPSFSEEPTPFKKVSAEKLIGMTRYTFKY